MLNKIEAAFIAALKDDQKRTEIIEALMTDPTAAEILQTALIGR